MQLIIKNRNQEIKIWSENSVVPKWWRGSLWLDINFTKKKYFQVVFLPIFNQGSVILVFGGKKTQGLEFFSSSNEFELKWSPPCTFNCTYSCTWLFLPFYFFFFWMTRKVLANFLEQVVHSFSSFSKIEHPFLNILLNKLWRWSGTTRIFKSWPIFDHKANDLQI